MARSNKHRRRASAHSQGLNRRHVLMMGGGITSAYIGLLAIASIITPKQPGSDIPYHQHIMVLLDTSDPYTVGQNQLIDQLLLENIPQKITYGDRLELYLLSDEGLAVRQLFNDRAPMRASDVNAAFEDPMRQEAIWEREFKAPFEAAVDEARIVDKQERSPLIEGLFEMSRTLRHSTAERKVIWVISDALQYSGAGLSAYNESLYQEGATYWQSYPADFGGAEVHVLYLFRPDKSAFQTERHQQWLTLWLSHAGAGSVDIIKG